MNSSGVRHVCELIFSLCVIGVTSYAVFWLHRSPWWFLAAYIVIHSFCGQESE